MHPSPRRLPALLLGACMVLAACTPSGSATGDTGEHDATEKHAGRTVSSSTAMLSFMSTASAAVWSGAQPDGGQDEALDDGDAGSGHHASRRKSRKKSGRRHKRGAERPDNPDDPHALRILTLNAEHLMSPAIFEKWHAFCSRVGWKDRRSQPRPKGLPYCDALNGHDQQGRQIFGPLRTRQDLQAKYQQLGRLVQDARADIILMQEVTDAAAVRAVLGEGWTIHTTAEHWQGGPQNSQNLAFAWRTSRFGTTPRVEVVDDISRSTEGRRIRPGLAMYLPLASIRRVGGGLPGSDALRSGDAPRTGAHHRSGASRSGERRTSDTTRTGQAPQTSQTSQTPQTPRAPQTPQTPQTLAILNVHLKAGCRNGRMDRSPGREPAQYWRRQHGCEVLQHQVPALEAWLDRHIAAGHAVLVSGDFNRNLREEQNRALPARADGSSPASRLRRPEDVQRIASVLPELNDGDPVGADLTLIRSGPYRQLAQCHKYIDPFVASRRLGEWLRQPLDSLQVRVIPFEAPLSLDRPRPSDHCPHLLALPLR